MREVAAYKMLKTMENHYPFCSKSGRCRLEDAVVHGGSTVLLKYDLSSIN